jgi:hypothetical protein
MPEPGFLCKVCGAGHPTDVLALDCEAQHARLDENLKKCAGRMAKWVNTPRAYCDFRVTKAKILRLDMTKVYSEGSWYHECELMVSFFEGARFSAVTIEADSLVGINEKFEAALDREVILGRDGQFNTQIRFPALTAEPK